MKRNISNYGNFVAVQQKTMSNRSHFISCVLVFFSLVSFANGDPEIKQLNAQRVSEEIKIDGFIDENVWSEAEGAHQFIQHSPVPGEKSTQKNDIRILYDNKAIYIAAYLYDNNPEAIDADLSERDDIGQSDWFGLIIDSYQDGINASSFSVSSAGVQMDAKFAPRSDRRRGGRGVFGNADKNWDAVWDSKVRITKDGWVAEIKIPYSALRFPKTDVQNWNINFVRYISRLNELTFWNEVDPSVSGIVNQSGVLKGLMDIKAPVRLSATPFIVLNGLHNYDPETTPKTNYGRSFNAGMDVKYGINDAFTLDMTLIPDFGESQSDNKILNLSPFEVKFDENRGFFTEGLELFSKGDLFYSRRVGGRPMLYHDVEDELMEGEEIIDNPSNTQLYNATKISGRTNKGLGIGFFNAISGNTFAEIENQDGDQRSFLTNPLSNYNVFVFDQSLKNNSYVALVNTSVMREGHFYDANVTGTNFSLKNKNNSYSISGGGALSQKYYTDDTDLGYKYNMNASKISGQWQYSLSYNEESSTYDINDLGFIRGANERQASARLSYNIYQPFSIFSRANYGMRLEYTMLQMPSKFREFQITAWNSWTTKSFYSFGFWLWSNPIASHDYFEPRTDDFSKFYVEPASINANFYLRSDPSKPLTWGAECRIMKSAEEGRHGLRIEFDPEWQVSKRLILGWDLELEDRKNDVGYVSSEDNFIVFGKRDVNTIENVIGASYNFSPTMTINIRGRHYWSSASYSSFHSLLDDGTLGNSDYDDFSDHSFNLLNIDLVYKWRFAPGSDLFFIWKNEIFNSASEEENLIYNYRQSFDNLGESPQSNTLSIKLIYYLDYLSLTRKK